MFGKKSLIISLILLLFTSTACTNKNQSQNNVENPANMIPKQETQLDILTGKNFPDSDQFIVDDFILSYNKFDNSLIISLTYKMGPNPRKFLLNGDHSYYFFITVPDDLQEYFESPESNITQGKSLLDDDNAKYQIYIKAPLKKGIGDTTIETLINSPEGYSLTLYEEAAYPAKKIVNVYEGLELLNK